MTKLETLKSLHSDTDHATEARKLAANLRAAAERFEQNPAELTLLCMGLRTDVTPSEAIGEVGEVILALLGKCQSEAAELAALEKSEYARLAPIRNAAIQHANEISAKINGLQAVRDAALHAAQVRRGQLANAGVGAEEVDRIAPLPADDTTEKRAKLEQDRAACLAFKFDESTLPAGVKATMERMALLSQRVSQGIAS